MDQWTALWHTDLVWIISLLQFLTGGFIVYCRIDMLPCSVLHCLDVVYCTAGVYFVVYFIAGFVAWHIWLALFAQGASYMMLCSRPHLSLGFDLCSFCSRPSIVVGPLSGLQTNLWLIAD